ncbi:UDP-N-acetylmuramoyl-L-alanyl-D-glutamate--2,6-diaminopimelate ligase [Desulfobulbus alkaliphilus]|uniref:UDP-N-acetylmuramoyl-L-alanyl-D-glutamate--2, 6-diaminopimelate ligase n=1 Tax=Desulfobulbus alkaliphilus TaxID=869814 RepID=UPI001966288E|nr:UDP-N-acetylmuramoyl-L-alanyl-D-glutamate--2,6-diaminopimelate ligase [Desulfobulbus alkaliphilus]MBM9536031.1 UDP-N-acetylmuramoyl-L-alanyl-D-glutamate--2,6-diaminopimelate ligase [Desulfobulbus alkaliphilus]
MNSLTSLIKVLDPVKPVQAPESIMMQPVIAVTCDSRKVLPGSIFVAIRGAKVDGHAFIPEAIGRGCLAVVMEADTEVPEPAGRVPLVLVTDSHDALARLVAAWHGHPGEQMQLIAITGTNGKTTCSWLIEGMLLAAGYRPGVIGTVNYRYHDGTNVHILGEATLTTPGPETLQGLLRTMVDNQVTHVIIEVSSHALVQQRLGAIGFDVALFTNLSRDHLDYHGTMEGYFVVKEQLFRRYLKKNGVAVLVVDGVDGQQASWGERLAASLPARTPRIFCGLTHGCEVRASEIEQNIRGCTCTLHLKGESLPFTSSLTGRHNLLNVLAAAGVGLSLKLPVARICGGLAQVERIPGRLERVVLPGLEGHKGPAVFVDYAHTPDALENVLQTLRQLATGRLVCVFGCGGDRDPGKRSMMGMAAGRLADAVLLTSDNPRTEDPEAIINAVAQGVAAVGRQLCSPRELFTAVPLRDGYAVISDRRRAIIMACSLATDEDTILIAGKGHEQYQVIGASKHFFDDRITAMNGLLHWNAQHLLAATGGKVVAGKQQELFGTISTDSRTLVPGDIFIALDGETFDGHAYIEAAIAAGALAVIASRIPANLSSEILYVQVPDTLQALGRLAAYRRRLVGDRVKVAAVTGSSGKTTVKEMTAAVFAEAMAGAATGVDPVLKTLGNFNNLVGLPLSLLPLEAGHRLAIVEMGMNAPGEIARLVAIADPDVGCINNVHPAHLLGLGSIEGVARAKGELFAGMRPEAVRVVNYDDPHVRRLAARTSGNQIGFATTDSGRRHRPLVRVTRQQNLGERGMRFTLHIDAWKTRLTVAVVGEHNVANCAAAAAIAHAAGIAPESIARGLERYRTVDRRLVTIDLPGGLRLANDVYNANPGSMAAGLRTVAAFGSGCRHMAVLGDMLELGPAAEDLHRGIGTLVAQLGYTFLAITGNQASQVAEAAVAGGMKPADVQVFPEPRAIASRVLQLLTEERLTPGDWLLVKGSRGMRMERFIEELTQQLNSTQRTE